MPPFSLRFKMFFRMLKKESFPYPYLWEKRKGMKKMYLYVLSFEGKLKVRTGYYVSKKDIENFILQNEDFILKQRRLLLAKEQEKEQKLALYNAAFLEERFLANVKKLNAWILKYESSLQVKVKKLSFRKMRHRFGTCYPTTQHILLNKHLFYYSSFCVEYVLLHEMVHLIEKNHHAAFYAKIEEHFPAWKKAEELLNQETFFLSFKQGKKETQILKKWRLYEKK